MEFKTSDIDGIRVKTTSVVPPSPRVVLQVVHGMMEHSERYLEFAKWLASQGIAVYLSDHFGHGKNLDYTPGQAVKGSQIHGHLADKDGWKKSIEALNDLNQVIQKNHPGLPVIMLGHSMGSVMVQSYMRHYGKEVSGFILSGTMSQPRILINAGVMLADILRLLYGPHHRSGLLIKLGYGSYSKFFKPKRTDFDWLCSNQAVVDEYVNDPFCGFPCTTAFYSDFFRGIRENITQPKVKIGGNRSMLIIGGEKDPAGHFGKDPERFARMYRKAGFSQVELKLWPEGRHEMLNEVNKEEVWEVIRSWAVGQMEVGRG